MVTGSLVWRRLVLVGTPLALAVLEIFHPQPTGAVEAVEQGEWFFWFHMIQVPLIGLIALAVYLLTEGLVGRAVTVSRWAAGVFAVFFSAYDAAAGIATGFVLRSAEGLSADEQAVVFEMVKDMPEVSLIFILSIVGTAGWVVALIAAAVALRRAGAARGPFVLLILAGVFLLGGHPFPFGTLAFGCFALATAWLELTSRSSTSVAQPRDDTSP
ncbi:MAG TPA: hypothetical protein VFB74_16215 [Kribbellaceae bacterium]|nr:hypothetical protein [Kribbellaceae bacterium]